MLAIGFDPSFVDTLVRVQNIDGSLAKKLPLPGQHNRTPSITRIAGGNGVNLSAVLTSLKIDNTLVVPYDEEFVFALQVIFFYNDKNGIRERILSGQHMLQMQCVSQEEKKEEFALHAHSVTIQRFFLPMSQQEISTKKLPKKKVSSLKVGLI